MANRIAKLDFREQNSWRAFLLEFTGKRGFCLCLQEKNKTEEMNKTFCS